MVSPQRILKHELPDSLTESRFRPRLRLPGGRCGAITCTYRTVGWSVPLPRTGEALLRLRTFPSKMSELATIVASPTWWRWPAAVSGRQCWAVVPRRLRRSRRSILPFSSVSDNCWMMACCSSVNPVDPRFDGRLNPGSWSAKVTWCIETCGLPKTRKLAKDSCTSDCAL